MSDQETRPQPRSTEPGSTPKRSDDTLKGRRVTAQKSDLRDPNPTVVSRPIPAEAGQKPTIMQRKGLIAGCAGLAVLAIVALVLAALFLPPFKLVGKLAGYDILNANNPTVSHPDGISVTLVGEGPLRLRLGSTPREAFLAGDAARQHPGALESLPSYLEMKSPLYTLDPQNEALVRVEVTIPNAAEPYHTLDLYRWDAETGMWIFVPSHIDVAAGVIRTDELPGNVAVFRSKAVTPLISTTLENDQTLDQMKASTLNLLIPVGLEVQADGSIGGTLVGGWQPGMGYAVVPSVHVSDPTVLTNLLNNPASLALHVEDLRALVVNGAYNGVAIDYRDVAAADRELYAAFITDLGAALDEVNKVLVVVLPRPLTSEGEWDTGGYDWRAIGTAADVVIVDAGPNPADYAINGSAISLLSWATGEINRYKIHLASSASSFDETSAVLINFEDALAALGDVTVEPAPSGGAASYTPGTTLTFRLSNELIEVLPDQHTGAYAVRVAGSGERQIWIVTANTVRARLDMISQYNIGGMMVNDLGRPGNDAAVAQAITEFKVKSASTLPSQLVMQWTVSDASGALLTESTGLGTPWVWNPAESGQFTVQGAIVGANTFERGSVAVAVGEPDATETPAGTATATRAPGTATPAASGTPAPTNTASTPPPAQGHAGSDGGGLEIGGQVPGYISHPDLMHQAGMRWVKFQVGWYPGADPGGAAGLVASGHANGFKVLLSVKGPLYPQSIDYTAYTQFIRGVAQAQPDAIEVWNEMNLNREWPAGQIDPANYVNNMLAPAFNAIKSVSPGTMVIIGALAPTGVDDGVNVWSDQRYVQGLAAAGAGRYANCIGVHHNAGATAPSASSGHPAGGHYSWYFQPTINVYYGGMGGALPVCFTEYGYVSPEGYGDLPGNFSWGADNTVAEQAAWLAEGVQIARSLGYVRLMIVWNVDFTKWEADDPQAGYAIVRPDGTCPACVSLGAVAP